MTLTKLWNVWVRVNIGLCIDRSGIEASRNTILRETNNTLSFDNGYVNPRHPSLLADIMVHLNYIMSVTRHGINRRESGPLSKCSFEETVEILQDAGRFVFKNGTLTRSDIGKRILYVV